eukprot:Gb_18275 [translate_table: standard]
MPWVLKGSSQESSFKVMSCDWCKMRLGGSCGSTGTPWRMLFAMLLVHPMICKNDLSIREALEMKEQKFSEIIAEKVREAKEVCEGNEISKACAMAWDEVEEVSQAKAHLKQQRLACSLLQ